MNVITCCEYHNRYIYLREESKWMEFCCVFIHLDLSKRCDLVFFSRWVGVNRVAKRVSWTHSCVQNTNSILVCFFPYTPLQLILQGRFELQKTCIFLRLHLNSLIHFWAKHAKISPFQKCVEVLNVCFYINGAKCLHSSIEEVVPQEVLNEDETIRNNSMFLYIVVILRGWQWKYGQNNAVNIIIPADFHHKMGCSLISNLRLIMDLLD